VGIANFVVLSDGTFVANQRYLAACEEKLSTESFDLAQADVDLNSHVNIFNLYGAFSS
jgi:hypothetical protein